MADRNLPQNSKKIDGLVDLHNIGGSIGRNPEFCTPRQLEVGDIATIHYKGKNYIIVVAKTKKTSTGKYVAAGTRNLLLTAFIRPNYMRNSPGFTGKASQLYKRNTSLGAKQAQVKYESQPSISSKKVDTIVDRLMRDPSRRGRYVAKINNLIEKVKERIRIIVDRINPTNPTMAEYLGEENFRTFIVDHMSTPCSRIR